MRVRAILEIRKRFRRKGKSLQTGGLQRALSYFEANFSKPIRPDDAVRESGRLKGRVSTILCQTIMNIPGEVISQGLRLIKINCY